MNGTDLYFQRLDQKNRIEEETRKVVNIELTDPDLAFSIWHELLCDYSAYLDHEDYIEVLVEDILNDIRDNHYEYFDKYMNGQVMMERVIPYLLKYPDMLELIYGVAGRASCIRDSGYSPICLACFIVSDQAEVTYKILEYLSRNQNIKDVKRCGHISNYIDFSVGKFLICVYDYVNILINGNEERKYVVTEKVKDVLLKSLDLFDDKCIKAECMIPIMAIIGYDYKIDS